MVILQSSFWFFYALHTSSLASPHAGERGGNLCCHAPLAQWAGDHYWTTGCLHEWFFQERIADSFPQDPTSTWWLSGCWWNHESVRWAGNERWGISFRDPGSEPTSPWLPMHALRCLGSLGVVGIDDGVGAMNLRYFWDHPCRQNHFIVR